MNELPIEVIEGAEAFVALGLASDGPPALKICANGDIEVYGTVAANDKDVAQAFITMVNDKRLPTVEGVIESMAQLSTPERVAIIKAAIEFEDVTPDGLMGVSARDELVRQFTECVKDEAGDCSVFYDSRGS